MFEKIAYILAFYIPFQVALNPVDYLDLASLRLILVIFFLFWLTRGLLNKNLRIPFSKTSIFLYFFLFSSLFSVFFAQNQLWSLRKLAFIFSILPIYFIFSAVFENKKNLIKVLEWLVFGSFLLALTGIVQFASQFVFGIEKVYSFWGHWVSPFFLGESFSQAVMTHNSWLVNVGGKTLLRSISVFPDPHMFSFYVGMTAPIALALFFAKKRVFFLISFIVLTLANLLSFSRGGYFGFIAGAIFFISYFIVSKKIVFTKKTFAYLLIVFALMISIFFSPFGNRLVSSFNLADGSNSERLRLWQQALTISLEHPMGVGIGNLPLKILPSANYRDPIYAHNLYLDISTEMGLLSLLFFMSMLFSAIVVFTKKAQTNIVYLGVACALIVFSFHSLAETPIYSVHILSLLLILLSIANKNVD